MGGIHVGLSRVMVMVVDKFRIRVLTSLEVAILFNLHAEV